MDREPGKALGPKPNSPLPRGVLDTISRRGASGKTAAGEVETRRDGAALRSSCPQTSVYAGTEKLTRVYALGDTPNTRSAGERYQPTQRSLRCSLSCPPPRCALAALACFGAPALAQITIPTVTIGSPGNPPDATTGFGSVAYVYNIGTTEVTNAQYAAFLNAKAKSDPFGLYNLNMAEVSGAITRSGSSGSYTYTTITGSENHPVNFVSFWDATRFANWLHNGQGSGDTETGAYTLNGVTNPFNPSVTRNADWLWAVTTRDEWYKAAFYQPFTAGGDSDNYWLYPTSSNSINTSQANYGNVISHTTPVGSYAANFNGTFDMAGNLREWTEAISDGVDDYRKVWGGFFLSPSDSQLQSGSNVDVEPTYEDLSIGFRLAQNPLRDCKPTWEQLASANRPSARVGYAMAYDAQRREHVLFGGDNGSGLWVIPGRGTARSGASWLRLARHPAHMPSRCSTRPGTVSCFSVGRTGNTYHNDTWEWNGSTWTRVLTANAPSQRGVAGMAFDSVRNRAVLFGGNGPSGHLGDLWEYDGTNWIAKPTHPSVRGSGPASRLTRCAACSCSSADLLLKRHSPSTTRGSGTELRGFGRSVPRARAARRDAGTKTLPLTL